MVPLMMNSTCRSVNRFTLPSYVNFLNFESHIDYPFRWEMEALLTNKGMGRGVVKRKRQTLKHNNVYKRFVQRPSLFKEYLFITHSEFDLIVNGMEKHRKELIDSSLLLSFENKVLMGLHFVIQYKGNKHLAFIFNVSVGYVTKVLDEILPRLVEYFCQYIPNAIVTDEHSRLHPQIKCVIDNTIHRTRRPRSRQSVQYNGHYHMHGRSTQILLDFTGRVVAFVTMIPGRVHDALAATYNHFFKYILDGDTFALADPGFYGICYVVPGFKPCQVKTNDQRVFDVISRREQVIIENMNAHFKICRSVNKEDSFYHGDRRLLACIFIALGMYNLKRDWGYFEPSF